MPSPDQAPLTSASPADERRGQGRGYGALVLVQLCFGLFPIFGKLAFVDFSPRVVAGWRFAVGAAVLGGIALVLHGRRAIPPRGDWPRLAVCALLGVVLNMVLFMEGLERSTAINAGLFMPMIPVWTFVIAVTVRQERFQWARGLGILLAFGGTLILILQEGPDLSQSHVTGNLLFATNTFCYSLYLVLSKPLLRHLPALVVTAWVFLLSVPTVPLFAGGETFVPSDASMRSWTSLLYVLAFPTVIAYLLNTFALARVAASTTAVFIFLQPLFACGGGVVFLGESFLPGTGVAAAIIFLGVWLVVRRKR